MKTRSETTTSPTTSSDERRTAHAFGLLTHVLCYDALQTDASMFLPVLGHKTIEIKIGRGSDLAAPEVRGNHLATPDKYVSREHARVWRRGAEDVIEDVDSKSGVHVNGVRCQQQILADGDLLEIGHSLFAYRTVDEAGAELIAAHPRGVVLGPTRTLAPPLMTIVLELNRIAPTQTTVLFLGETGVGKEIAAEHIHARSKRAHEPFVIVNCGGLPDSLVEGELFGHKKGAFTGSADRGGLIRAANRGTLFLDEIGNMSATAQARLLRVLEDRRVRRLGEDNATGVDVRWIAATNSNILAEASFRADLRARLREYVTWLPPLQARREDLGVLTAHVLSRLDDIRLTPPIKVPREMGWAFYSSAFPENVRQLRSALRTAASIAQKSTLLLSPQPSIPAVPFLPRPFEHASAPPGGLGQHRRPERHVLLALLEQEGWNQGRVARKLEVDEKQVRRWMDYYGIRRARSTGGSTE